MCLITRCQLSFLEKHMRVFNNTKISLAVTAAALSICSQAHSDILGVYAGGGVWQGSVSGGLSNPDSSIPDSVTLEELNIEDSQNAFAYVAFEHPLPLIPNIRVAMTNLNTEGESTIGRDIVLNDNFTFPADAGTQSDIDLSHIDGTLYYELLDNYISFDLGFTARSFSGNARLSYETGEAEGDTEELDLNGIIPMLYAKAQLDLPFTGWYAGGSANYVSITDSSITDAEAKIGYLSGGLGLKLGFDLGYRSFSIVANPDEDDFEADITIEGPYASLIVHF